MTLSHFSTIWNEMKCTISASLPSALSLNEFPSSLLSLTSHWLLPSFKYKLICFCCICYLIVSKHPWFRLRSAALMGLVGNNSTCGGCLQTQKNHGSAPEGQEAVNPALNFAVLLYWAGISGSGRSWDFSFSALISKLWCVFWSRKPVLFEETVVWDCYTSRSLCCVFLPVEGVSPEENCSQYYTSSVAQLCFDSVSVRGPDLWQKKTTLTLLSCKLTQAWAEPGANPSWIIRGSWEKRGSAKCSQARRWKRAHAELCWRRRFCSSLVCSHFALLAAGKGWLNWTR